MQIKRPPLPPPPSSGAEAASRTSAPSTTASADAASEGEGPADRDLSESAFVSESGRPPVDLPAPPAPTGTRTSPLTARLQAAGLTTPGETIDALNDEARKPLKSRITPDMPMLHRTTELIDEQRLVDDPALPMTQTTVSKVGFPLADLTAEAVRDGARAKLPTSGAPGVAADVDKEGAVIGVAGGATVNGRFGEVKITGAGSTLDEDNLTFSGGIQHTTGPNSQRRESALQGHLNARDADLRIDASTRRTTVTSDAEGNLVTHTVGHRANGSIADGDLDLERSRSITTVKIDDELVETVTEVNRQARVDLGEGTFAARASRKVTVDDGSHVEVRLRDAAISSTQLAARGSISRHDRNTGQGVARSASVRFGDRRLTVEVEKTTTDAVPEAGKANPAETVRARGEAHALGFSAEVAETTREADGVSKLRSARVQYDTNGLTLGRRRSTEDGAGQRHGFDHGIKVQKDQVGVTRSTHSVSSTASGERTGVERTTDVLVGNHSATVGLRKSRTHDTPRDDGSVRRASSFYQVKGTVDAYQEVKDLGPVDDGAPAELAGKHVVEARRVIGGGANGFAGALLGGLGVYGSLGLSSSREAVYRTHRDADAAAKLAAADEDPSLGAAVRRRTVGMSLVSPRLEIPDLARPESLGVFDSVELHTRGTIQGGGGAFVLGLRAGLHASMTGDFRLVVQKTAEDRVVVEVTPTNLRSLQGIGGAVLFDLSLGRVKAESFSQVFEFDLSRPSGRHAYLDALRGKLPGRIEGAMIDATDDALDVVKNDRLPPGVERVKLEKSEVQERLRQARGGWLFLQAGRSRSKTSGSNLVTDGKVAVNTRTESIESRRDTLLSGTESKGVSACVQLRTRYDSDGEKIRTFDSLNLTARYSDSKVRGDSLNGFAVEELRQALGLDLGAFSADGGNEKREISASVHFNEAALLRLSELSYEELREIVAERGLDFGTFETLAGRLKTADTLLEKANVVQKAVADGGITMMGAITRLAGDLAEVKLTTRSSLYDDTVKSAKTFADRYAAEGWSSRQTKSELTKRFSDIRLTLDKLDQAKARAESDPILAGDAAERARTLDDIAEARRTLEGLLDFSALSHETAVTVVQRLSQGWTTALQARFINDVVKAAGLTEVDIGMRVMRAASQRVQDRDAMVRTRSIASQKLLPLFSDARSQVSAASRIVRDERGWDVNQVRLRAEILVDAGTDAGKGEALSESLNVLFGTRLGKKDITDTGGGGRAMVLERFLTPEDLDGLRTLSPSTLNALATGKSADRVRDLGERLRRSADRMTLAEQIERHLQREGLAGMADIHRLVEGPLLLHSVTDTYLRAARGVDELKEKLSAKIRGDSPVSEVEDRFRKILDARGNLDEAWQRLDSDSLLTDVQKEIERERLLRARTDLEVLADTSHLDLDDAATLVTKLQTGWTSGAEEMAIDRIKADTGLDRVEAFFPGVIAYGRRAAPDGSTEAVGLRLDRGGIFTTGRELTRLEVRQREGTASGLEIDLRFFDGKEKGTELEDNVIRRLNKALGTTLSPHAREGDGSARQVTVGLSLDDDALKKLFAMPAAELASLGATLNVSAVDLRRVFEDAEPIGRLPRQAVLQRFLVETGIEGLGVVVRALSLRDAVRIDTESEGYTRASAEAAEILDLYDDLPWRATMDRDEVASRVKALERVRDLVTSALDGVKHDPLLDDAHREALESKLSEQLGALDRELSFSSLGKEDREQLAKKVERGFNGFFHGELARRIRGG